MVEFKVGDRVVGVGVCDDLNIDGKRGTVKSWNGMYASVHFDKNIGGWGDTALEIPSGHGWNVDAKHLRKLPNEKIVITHDGKTTLARRYEGNKVVQRTEAKCHPDDAFKFKKGAELAFNRLMYGTDYYPAEVALTNKGETEHSGILDWNEFKRGETAVHCGTKEKVAAFLKECHKRGIRWVNGEPTTQDRSIAHGPDRCYFFNTGYGGISHADIGYCKRGGRHIIECPLPAEPEEKAEQPEEQAVSRKTKAVCIETTEPRWWTVGKVYEFVYKYGVNPVSVDDAEDLRIGFSDKGEYIVKPEATFLKLI